MRSIWSEELPREYSHWRLWAGGLALLRHTSTVQYDCSDFICPSFQSRARARSRDQRWPECRPSAGKGRTQNPAHRSALHSSAETGREDESCNTAGRKPKAERIRATRARMRLFMGLFECHNVRSL